MEGELYYRSNSHKGKKKHTRKKGSELKDLSLKTVTKMPNKKTFLRYIADEETTTNIKIERERKKIKEKVEIRKALPLEPTRCPSKNQGNR